MFGHPALYAGQRLAACAYGRGIGVNLPADRVQALIAVVQSRAFQPYGRLAMQQWAHLEANTRKQVPSHADILAESLPFVDAHDES